MTGAIEKIKNHTGGALTWYLVGILCLVSLNEVNAEEDDLENITATFFLDELKEEYADGNGNTTYSILSLERLYEKSGLEIEEEEHDHDHSNEEGAVENLQLEADHDHSHDEQGGIENLQLEDYHDHDHEEEGVENENINNENVPMPIAAALVQAQSDAGSIGAQEEGEEGHGGECLSVEDLLALNNITTDFVTQTQFQDIILPAIVQMSESNACAHSSHHSGSNALNSKPTSAEIWGYAFLANIIISLGTLLAICFYPIIKRRSEKVVYYTILFITSMASGVLFTDAVLHLIPVGLGLHNHSHDEEGHEGHGAEEEELSEANILVRCCLIIVGAYTLFIMDRLLARFGGGHDCMSAAAIKATNSSTNKHISLKDVESEDRTVTLIPSRGSIQGRVEGSMDDEVMVKGSNNTTSPMNSQTPSINNDNVNDNLPWYSKIQNTAWVVMVGDSVHNFIDGIIIGSSFNSSIGAGVSTSIAIFLHEIPHELGDYGIYVSNGFTPMGGLIVNLLTEIPSFLGVVIGILAGENSVGYISMFAAGVFLYLSLYSLLTFIILQSNQSIGRSWIRELTTHGGLWIGFTVMLLIELYAENIVV